MSTSCRVLLFLHHSYEVTLIYNCISLPPKSDEICAEAKYLKIGDVVLADVHKRFKDNSVS